jgi:hypothetical protein
MSRTLPTKANRKSDRVAANIAEAIAEAEGVCLVDPDPPQDPLVDDIASPSPKASETPDIGK